MLETVYSVLVGPIKLFAGGSSYFLNFIEGKTRYAHVYLIRSKEQVFDKFKNYVASVKNKSGKAPEVLFTDGGTEYSCHDFQRFMEQHRIEHKVAIAHLPNRMLLQKKII